MNAARDEWEALRDFLCKEGEAVGISGVRFAPGTQPEYMRDYLRQGRLSIQGAGSQLVLEAPKLFLLLLWPASLSVPG